METWSEIESELKRKNVWDWVAAHPDMSAKRIRNVLSVLRISLNSAVEQELIESNSAGSFQGPQTEQQCQKVRKLTRFHPNSAHPSS